MLYLILWPLSLVLRLGYETSLRQTFDAIKICDLVSLNDAQRQLYCSRTVKALELIKEYDAKRFCRIQKHLVYIVSCRTFYGADYNHWLRACEVNFSRFRFEEDEDWGVLMLACTIIYEATHGVITTQNIPYDKKHRLRVERICYQEEVRFARRVMPEVDLGEFDESEYRNYFQMGRWQYVVKSLRTIFQPDQPAV